MTFNQYVFLLVLLCGISLKTVLGQMDSISNNNAGVENQVVQAQPDAVAIDESTEDNDDDDDDDDDDDVMVRLGQVESIYEFMSLLRIDGREVTEQDIIDNDVDENGKVAIAGGGRMAIPDNCSPRNTTIRITMAEETDSDTAFFPRCTKIERCGGCCSSPNLECVPRYTERVSLQVLKGRVPYPGAPHLEYSGFANVIVDRHMTCRVNCRLTAALCGPLKDFSRRKCSCKCKNPIVCPPPHVWDPEECTCKCPHVAECCDSPNHCGMVWSTNLCQCVLSNDGRLLIVANDNAQSSTSSTTTTTTTTTSSTEAPTTPFDPCRTHSCPGRLVKVRRGDGCSCSMPTGNRFNSRTRGRRVRG